MWALSRITQKYLWVIHVFLVFLAMMGQAQPWIKVNPHEDPVMCVLGTPVWHDAHHVSLPVVLRLAPGWKLMGPSGKGDTLVRPPQLLLEHANVAKVSVVWPEATLFQDQGQQSHVYTKNLEVMVDITLRHPSLTQVSLAFSALACSTLCRPFSETLTVALSPPVTGMPSSSSFWHMLWYAFFGGLILNIMPCVFPILGLKLSGLATAPPGLLHQVCVATILGIFVSFFCFALLLILLQHVLNYEVGWGIQFQNPYFASFMSVFMVLMAHSFWGGLSVETPSWLQKLLPRKAGPREHAFFSGMLAVFLATPCSAPFLGAAVGFALTASSWHIMAIFLCIAWGFSLPYWISFFVPLGKFLPKPGPWMGYVSAITGGFFVVTALWLMYGVLRVFLTPLFQGIAWGLLVVVLVVPFFPRIFAKTPGGMLTAASPWWRGLLWGASGALFLVPFFNDAIMGPEKEGVFKVAMTTGKILWTPWSEAAMEKVLDTGRIVFLDVTSVACLNCEVNKKRVLEAAAIQQLLTSQDIVCMRGDFSMGSDAILKMLKRYGRAGIPFNLVLSRHYPEGLVLSEFLSVQEVEAAVTFLRQKASEALSSGPKTLGV